MNIYFAFRGPGNAVKDRMEGLGEVHEGMKRDMVGHSHLDMTL